MPLCDVVCCLAYNFTPYKYKTFDTSIQNSFLNQSGVLFSYEVDLQ